ncbi:uncharacterized protein [Lolium perenne]|uniref:uncharacterized protein n=1 Tax=Lolium perenne TaxID=4522 RepID=UPI0021F68EF9|nr:uncharacterized protein LOC127303195 [Lolium perenne]
MGAAAWGGVARGAVGSCGLVRGGVRGGVQGGRERRLPRDRANAINCRYTLINRETVKFCGCLQQIINLEESGRTIQEKTNDAHIMFKELDTKKKPFTLMHCYVEFSKYPKWQTRELETSVKKQKKTIDASPGTVTNDPADASSVRTDATSAHTDALEHEKRPDGVKKEKLRRGKADDSACKLSLETVWAQKQEKDELKEAARNVRYAQQFELRKEEIALKKKEDAQGVLSTSFSLLFNYHIVHYDTSFHDITNFFRFPSFSRSTNNGKTGLQNSTSFLHASCFFAKVLCFLVSGAGMLITNVAHRG